MQLFRGEALREEAVQSEEGVRGSWDLLLGPSLPAVPQTPSETGCALWVPAPFSWSLGFKLLLRSHQLPETLGTQPAPPLQDPSMGRACEGS